MTSETKELPTDYFDYIDGLTVDGWDQSQHDAVYKAHILGQTQCFYRHPKKIGHLDKLQTRLTEFLVNAPRRAGLSAGLLFFATLGSMAAFIDLRFDGRILALLVAMVVSITISAIARWIIEEISWRLVFFPTAQIRVQTRNMRQDLSTALGVHVRAKREAAVSEAKSDDPDRGPQGLLKLLLLSRLHWDLGRILALQYKLLRFNLLESAIPDEEGDYSKHVQLAFIAGVAGALVVAMLIVAERAMADSAVLLALATAFPVLTAAFISAVVVRGFVYAAFRSRVIRMIEAHAFLFEPSLKGLSAEEQKILSSVFDGDALTEWSTRSDLADFHDFTAWLRKHFQDFPRQPRAVTIARADVDLPLRHWLD